MKTTSWWWASVEIEHIWGQCATIICTKLKSLIIFQIVLWKTVVFTGVSRVDFIYKHLKNKSVTSLSATTPLVLTFVMNCFKRSSVLHVFCVHVQTSLRTLISIRAHIHTTLRSASVRGHNQGSKVLYSNQISFIDELICPLSNWRKCSERIRVFNPDFLLL